MLQPISQSQMEFLDKEIASISNLDFAELDSGGGKSKNISLKINIPPILVITTCASKHIRI
jgi:hypothetical protein